MTTITGTKQSAEDIAAAFPDIVWRRRQRMVRTPQLTAAGYVDSTPSAACPARYGLAVRARLRSASFTITWTEKHLFEITTRGYGHAWA
jgi:hypothetical protein